MVNLVLAYPEEAQPARSLSAALGCDLAFVERHVFPDGESKLTLPARLPEEVVLLRGLHQPNAKLAELMLLVPACRELGVRRLQLVSPYLAYMRQDIAFNPGEVVSQRHLANLLGSWFDRVVTVDPHLHRIASLDEVMPPGRGHALTAAPLLGDWLASQVESPVLLAPDEEALQWVQAAALSKGLLHGACQKVRRGDRDVQVTLPQGLDIKGRCVVLLDDVASTGRTLAQAATAALAAGALSVDAAVTHALFMPGAMEDLAAAGVRHVWSTDSVPHPSNVVTLAPMLAAALR